jgi:transcriptional regulator GlxA family with amidase domain
VPLLRHGKLSIDEIAGKCGFADRYHFSKSFRKYFGLPPAEFRMRHNNQA